MEHAPRSMTLPPNPHYRRALYVGLLTGSFFLVGVWLVLFSGGWFDGSQFLGVMVCLISLIVSVGAFAERHQAKRVDKLLTAISQRKFIAQWKYTPDEWQRFAECEARLIWKELRTLAIIMGVGSLGGIAAMFLLEAKLHAEKPFVIVAVVGSTLLLVGGLGVIYGWVRLGYCRSIRAHVAAPPDTYIGRGFVISANYIITWGGFNQKLAHLVLLADELPLLEFGLQSGKNIVAYRVLIPQRFASHAETLVSTILAGQQAPSN